MLVFARGADRAAAVETLQMCACAATCSTQGLDRVAAPPAGQKPYQQRAHELGALAQAVVLHDSAGIAAHFKEKSRRVLPVQPAPDGPENTVLNAALVAPPAEAVEAAAEEPGEE